MALILKESAWNKLNTKLAKSHKDKKNADGNNPNFKVHCRIPKCLGYEKENSNNETEEAKEQRLVKEANEFEALIKGIIEKNYNYTIYLAPKDIKALHDWLLTNAKILQAIPKNKIVLLSEWRKTETWKLAFQRYQNLYSLVEKLSDIDLKNINEEQNQLLEQSKKLFNPVTDEGKIIEEAKKILNSLTSMLAIDIAKTKKRESFINMSEDQISDHIKVETTDYISWKQLLSDDGTEPENGEINVLMYQHDLFKSMQIIDSFADKMGYTRNTPIHIKPETEEVLVEDTVQNKDHSHEETVAPQTDVYALLQNIIFRISLEQPVKGYEFFRAYVNDINDQKQQAKKDRKYASPEMGLSPIKNRTNTLLPEAKNTYRPSGNRSPSSQSTYDFVRSELNQKNQKLGNGDASLPFQTIIQKGKFSDSDDSIEHADLITQQLSYETKQSSVPFVNKRNNGSDATKDRNRMFQKPVSYANDGNDGEEKKSSLAPNR